ncbi:GNAT family N-acetyltransferase [Rubrimonas cliftonensis]|uniref:N-acetyltransferase domain-containing protein n=1 Tax=Rubrimonas cliftonensis TaxID=89524 RepID=A0A1H3ZJM0_9RHOB|nr:GNAT family N-acetyltransferase [Rubrimonas cliftonensis]SEA23857.1 hypothetical protein SAMN05444370_103565 [Rubrimonas cliftonensis]
MTAAARRGEAAPAAARWGVDASAALALNAAHEAETGPLDGPALDALLAGAFHVGAEAGGRDALLIAFDEGASYDSPNYRWFRERFPRFVYVDRVIVAPAARGRGVARRLYGALFARAVAAGHGLACCEINSAPPNPGSDAFHARLGFAEAGAAVLPERGKAVRYLTRALTCAP